MGKLIAEEVALEIIRELKDILPRIAQFDRNLADEGKRAGTSIYLNCGEGSRRIGRDRQHFWRNAFGSTDEVHKVINTAVAWGYIEPPVKLLGLLDREQRLFFGLTGGRASYAKASPARDRGARTKPSK